MLTLLLVWLGILIFLGAAEAYLRWRIQRLAFQMIVKLEKQRHVQNVWKRGKPTLYFDKAG